MKETPRAILFDLDDTIVSWDMVADRSWQTVCHSVATATDGIDADALYSAIVYYREWYLSDITRHHFARLNLHAYRQEVVAMALSHLKINQDGLADRIAGAYGIEREKACYVLPGALETLRYFRERGVRLALVSNGVSEGQRRKVARFGLASHFDFIFIEGDFGLGKPDGRVFRQVLEALGTDADASWMVGDSLTFDIAGGRNAGLYTVWVDWKGDGLPEPATVRPDRIVRNIAALKKPE